MFRLLTKIFSPLEHNRGSYRPEEFFPKETPASLIEIYEQVKPYTMTSPERIFALCRAVEYIQKESVKGDIVECGVWKGGSMMAVAKTLLKSSETGRNLFLFDTFEGMTPPTGQDVDVLGQTAESLLKRSDKTKDDSVWCCASLEIARSAMYGVGYPIEKIHFVKGMVEHTIPSSAPDKIALLRLDTDWYESTKHEMEHLFPRLSIGGVLIIDDYGHWQGARKAVDEYFEINKMKITLHEIDYTGRIVVRRE
jgi:hypothetical protein